MTPEELQAELELERDAKIKADAALEKQIAAGLERQRKPFVDLTPTAAFLDSMYGTKLAPASADLAANRLKEEALLNDLLGKRTEAQAKAALANAQNRDAYKQDRQQARFDESQSKNEYKYVFDTYGKERKAIDEVDNQFKSIESALATGNVERVKAVLAQYARLNGEKGVLTDADLGRTFIPTLDSTYQGLMARLGNKTGKLSDSDLQNLRGGIEDARRNLSGTASAKLNDYRASFENSPYERGFRAAEPGVVKGIENKVFELGRVKTRAQAPTDGGMTDVQKARLAELKALKAAGKI